MQYAVHTNNVILNEMFNQNVNGIATVWNGLFNVLNDEFSFDCHAFPEKNWKSCSTNFFAVGYCLIISKPYSSSGIFFFHFLLSSLLLLYNIQIEQTIKEYRFFGTVSVKESIKQTKFHEDDVFYSNTYSRRTQIKKISKAGTKNQKTVPNMKKKRIRTCWQCCLFRLRGNNTVARSEGTIALQPLTN